MFNNQRGSIVSKLALFFIVSTIVYSLSYNLASQSIPEPSAIVASTIFALIAFTLMFIIDLIASRGDKKRKK
jgi:hypothetical protein